MRRTLVGVVLALSALAAAAAGQSQLPEAVRETVNEGARLYREGRFAEAQEHFERALAAAPGSRMIALFVARAAQQQYKPGVRTPENRAKGAEAVAAYERLLALDPDSEDAYKAVVFLHAQMGDEEKVREALRARADNPRVAASQRADAFTILASREWECSYDITERGENKRALRRRGGASVRYVMPRVRADFARARGCVEAGLDLVGQAEQLAPGHLNALSYKANLLREAAKLAEMEGDRPRRDEYERRYLEAYESYRRLSEGLEEKRDAGAAPPED